MAQHCPECGFANADGANYCQRCGAFIGEGDSPTGANTALFTLAETGELEETPLEQLVAHGGALVIRSGGGRAGETFVIDHEEMQIGRSPSSAIFLDDVTVSREHAKIVPRDGELYLDDCGSLNGTYVNRRRIESHRLEDGDELQIGKYKLAFLAR